MDRRSHSTSAGQIKVFNYTTRTVSAWGVAGMYPSWSPDGTQIAYSQQYGGPLHLINADGTNQRVITGSRPYSESPPAWSPDSKWLIAQNIDYGTLDIIEVATGNVLPITNAAGYVSPNWK
jgi:Tol biopolymer transport system component